MLYDTFGFPVDLTRLMAEEIGLGIDEPEFEAAQAKSREASKASIKSGAKDAVKLDVHDIAALESNDKVPKTDDTPKFGELFVRNIYNLFIDDDELSREQRDRDGQGYLSLKAIPYIYQGVTIFRPSDSVRPVVGSHQLLCRIRRTGV